MSIAGAPPTISVTMATYNVAPYVAASVESVLSQSFTDFEFIIVDDGSTDNTRKILQHYADQDTRIRLVFKSQNGGLAAARNDAIAIARGDWVTFLDGDDIFRKDMLEKAVSAGQAADADMVLWDFTTFSDETAISTSSTSSRLATIDGDDRSALLALPAFAWTRLIRRDALLQHKIQFANGLTYQDVPPHWVQMTALNKIALVSERLVFYRQQPNATTAKTGWKRADYFHILDQVAEYLRTSGLEQVYGDILVQRQLEAWAGVYDIIDPDLKPRVLDMITNRYSATHTEYIRSNKPLRWRARTFFKALNGQTSAKLALALWANTRQLYRLLSKIAVTA